MTKNVLGFLTPKALKNKAVIEAQKAKVAANNFKRSQENKAKKDIQTNLPQVVKLFHHLS
jgi:hypothetical protein